MKNVTLSMKIRLVLNSLAMAIGITMLLLAMTVKPAQALICNSGICLDHGCQGWNVTSWECKFVNPPALTLTVA